MPQKTKTDGELWKSLTDLDDDLLDPNYPEAAVDDELRELGIDPVVLAKRGADIATNLREEERLSWQTRARERGARMAAIASRVVAAVDLGRAEILKRLDELRSTGSGPSIAAAFRKRRPEESSDDELRALLEDMEALRAIDDKEREP